MPGAAVDRAGAREPGLAAARGAVLCSGHVGFAPCPAGGAAEGRGEWVPSPGRAPRAAFGGKEGSRHRQGSAGGSSARWAAACAHWAGSPCGPWLFVGAGGGLGVPRFPSPQPTPSRGRTFGGAGAGAVGVRARCRRHWCGAGPSPGGCWLLVCATAAAAAAAAAAVCGRVSARPWLSPALPGRKGTLLGSRPRLSLPSPPVAGARHRGAAAESAGQSRPCPGGSRVCRGGSSSGALWAQSDCPTSLPVQGRTDGRTEEPSHAGSCGAPRKKPGRLRRGRRCRLPRAWPRSWLGTALPRPAGAAAAPAQLFGPPFVLGPVPTAGAVGLVVRAPVRCWSSLWTAPVQFAGPAQLWFLFPCFCSGFRSSSWTAPVHFHASLRMVPARLRLWLGCSSGSSPLPVPFSTRSFWLQLGLVKTILAFGKVVNQSLS